MILRSTISAIAISTYGFVIKLEPLGFSWDCKYADSVSVAKNLSYQVPKD